MRIVYFSFVALISLSFISCTSDPSSETTTVSSKKEQHVFAKFYIRYLQTDKELKAEASFLEGDTFNSARPIVLSNVLFKGNEMKVQQLGGNHGVRYSFRNTGPHSKQYMFNFSGDQIGAQEHEMGMEPIIDFILKEGVVEKDKELTIVWEGSPLDDNQELVLLFTDENKKAAPVLVKGPTKRSELILSPEQIKNLNPGPGKLMIVKKQLQQTIDKNLTIFSEMEFYSNNLDIKVVD